MKNKQRWGLEWGAGGVKLVRTIKKKDRWFIDQRRTLEWPLLGNAYPIAVDPLTRVPALRAFVKEQKLPRLAISLCVPRYETFLRVIDYGEEIPLMIAEQAAREFPLALEKLYWGAQLTSIGSSSHLVLAGIPCQRLDRIVEALKSAGLDVESAGLNIFAQMESLAVFHKAPSSYALLDFGQSHIQLTLVKEGKVHCSRSYYAGSLRWEDRIREILESPDGKQGPLIVTGGEVRSAFVNKFSSREMVKIPSDLNLYLGASGQAMAPPLWLIPPGQVPSPVGRYLRAHRKSLAALAGGVVFLLPWVSARLTDAGRLEIKSMEREVQSGQEAGGHLEHFNQSAKGTDILAHVMEQVPPRACLSEFHYEAEQKKISLRGRADGYETVSGFVSRLTAGKKFREVRGAESHLSRGGAYVEFSIEGRLL